MAIPLLEAIAIEGKDITADALLTQRKLARYLVEQRHAHYHFTVKTNQPTLHQDIALYFHHRQAPDFVDPPRLRARQNRNTAHLDQPRSERLR